MELTFSKINDLYIADFQATKDFNIHIEGGGRIVLYKRTSGTMWDVLASVQNRSVFDADTQVNTAREYRISCEHLPSVATITEAQ